MEDALISPAGFMILSGAGLIEAATGKPIYVHATETIELEQSTDSDAPTQEFTSGNFMIKDDYIYIELGEKPFDDETQDNVYVMLLDDEGEITTEPYIGQIVKGTKLIKIPLAATKNINGRTDSTYQAYDKTYSDDTESFFKDKGVILVDYYVARESGAQQIDITADKFGGNYYLEASTLFKNTQGVDMPAEFIIPNCKIQSNFTFTMASSGDPSSFSFTMDAFPDYTRFDRTKKVLAAIQIIGGTTATEVRRASTKASYTHSWDETANTILKEAGEKQEEKSSSSIGT